jgi:uncharacterized membrane protein
MQPRPEALALAPAVLATGLFAARFWRTGEDTYGFLLFNLALAALPALLALVADALDRANERRATVAVLLAWLAFLPNAPYVLTDFVHLRPRAEAPLWFDVALIGAAALAGFALGAASLVRVHAILSRRLGGRVALGAIALASLLSGYGIYLGRFTRLNSWDVVFHPLSVVARALPPLYEPRQHFQAWAVTLVFGGLTLASFAAHAGRTGHERA